MSRFPRPALGLIAWALVCAPSAWADYTPTPALASLDAVAPDDDALLAGDQQIAAALRGAFAPWESAPEVSEPRWSFRAGTILLQRSTPSSNWLLKDYAQPMFTTDRFHFAMQGGIDLQAVRRGESFDLDFRYFDVSNMGAAQSFVPASSSVYLNLQGSVLIMNQRGLYRGLSTRGMSLLPPLPIQLSYRSHLASYELNARREVLSNVSLLAGFRYLYLSDTLNLHLDPHLVYQTFGFQAAGSNRLLGAQVGVEGLLWQRGRLRIDCAAKAGLYGNLAQSIFRLNSDGDTIHLYDRSLAAFVGDIGLGAQYDLTKHWSLRTGYQLLWFDGVALGSDQFSAQQNLTQYAGDVFFQGILASVQASW